MACQDTHSRRRNPERRALREARVCWGAALAVSLGGGAAAQTAIPPSAKDFASAAAQSDHYEILAGRLAVTQSRDPRVRAFAQQMIDAHEQTSERLNQAATASGLPPPLPAMSSDQAAMLAALQSLTGEAFDQAYAMQQVLAHEQALAVEKSYAAAGGDPNLQAAAGATVPVIEHHLEMARRIRAALADSETS